MRLLLENWRGFVNEMISSEELRAFDEKYSDAEKVEETAHQLAELGWDPEAIEHHKNEQPPYAEIRTVILDLDKFHAPQKVEPISSKNIFMDDDTISDREQKYQAYKSGKIDKYFRDSDKDPDEIEFEKAPPITVIQRPDGKLEVADGNHRAFLAKKNNATLSAWVIKLK
jgi:hypothetical protein